MPFAAHDQAIDHRQSERRGFSRARLGARDEIVSAECDGDRLGLNWRWLLVAVAAERSIEDFRESELTERQ